MISGHSYTLTLINHDDGVTSDASYTLFDSVSVYYSAFSSIGSNSEKRLVADRHVQ